MDSTLKDKIEALKNLLDSMDDDTQRSDEGTLTAGARVRKSLQELKRIAQAARLFCLERDHARKLATKTK